MYTQTFTASTTLTARLRSLLACAAALVGVLSGAACDVDTLDERSSDLRDVDAALADRDELHSEDPDADEASPEAEVVGEWFTSDVSPTGKNTVTVCYCGLYQGSPLYVGVECAGYPSAAVCCSEKCSELIGALNGQN